MTGHAALLAGHALFLWMFLAANPLEQLGGAAAEAVRADAYRFAAAWRHGMAGNSPIYMPGFFLGALATWIWVGSRGLLAAAAQGLVILGLGVTAAWAAAPMGAALVVRAFADRTGVWLQGPVPLPDGQSLAAGLYTLVTWSVFVAACQRALVRRSWRPLIPVPCLTGGLMAIRPWTVDDFTRDWLLGAFDGNPAAIFSLVAVPALSAVLARDGIRRSSSSADPHAPQNGSHRPREEPASQQHERHDKHDGVEAR